MQGEGYTEMVAKLAPENNAALISEEDDATVDSSVSELDDYTKLDDQGASDEYLKLSPTKEQFKDKIEENDTSHTSEVGNRDSIMSDDFTFNFQNILDGESRENTGSEEISQVGSFTIEPTEETEEHTTDIENETDEAMTKRLQTHFDRHSELELELE